jgi:hypothetical protein
MKKNPILKLRYSNGLGDILKCILHSKYIGKITHFITKTDTPCPSCSERATALNILFPIPVWKFFFKSVIERDKFLIKEMKDYGYSFIEKTESEEFKHNDCNCNKKDITYIETNNVLNGLSIDYIKYEGFSLIEKKEKNDQEYKTVIFKYKKNIDVL